MVWSEERRAKQAATVAAKKAEQPDALDGAVAVAERPDDMSLEERAARAVRRRGGLSARPLTPLEQVRPFDQQGAPDKSAAAYYLRPDGATIADVLILYPNGAQLSRRDDPRGRFSQDAEYHQSRMRRKGFEYVGPTLTREGARRMVEIIMGNRDEEAERLRDEIALSEHTIANSDIPRIRDGERARRDQLTIRLQRVLAPIDPDALVDELAEIARAQKMANVNPDIIDVMREMLDDRFGQVDAKFADAMKRFAPPMPEGNASQRASDTEDLLG